VANYITPAPAATWRSGTCTTHTGGRFYCTGPPPHSLLSTTPAPATRSLRAISTSWISVADLLPRVPLPGSLYAPQHTSYQCVAITSHSLCRILYAQQVLLPRDALTPHRWGGRWTTTASRRLPLAVAYRFTKTEPAVTPEYADLPLALACTAGSR